MKGQKWLSTLPKKSVHVQVSLYDIAYRIRKFWTKIWIPISKSHIRENWQGGIQINVGKLEE